MTDELASNLSERLSDMKVPVKDFSHPLGKLIAQWTAEGGTLGVRQLPDDNIVVVLFKQDQPHD